MPLMKNHPFAHHYHHDPLSNAGTPLGVPDTVGSFLTLDSVSRGTQNTSTSATVYLICQWTSSDVRVCYLNSTSRAVVAYATTNLTSSQPHQIRPLRMSMRLRNTSVFTSQQGVVRSLCLPNALLWEWEGVTGVVSTNFLDEVASMMGNHPQTRSYTAADLASTHVWVMPPASSVGLREYQNYANVGGIAGTQNALIDGANVNGINTLILQLPPTTAANAYDWACHQQDACRFPSNTLYAGLQKEAPTISASGFNQGVAGLQRDASMGVPESSVQAGKRQRYGPILPLSSGSGGPG